MSILAFLIPALLALAGGAGVVLAKQPVHQVLALVLNFLGLAALYLTLASEFMAVIQLIIYAGAIMVLFLFVIALLTARKDPIERNDDGLQGQRLAGTAAGIGLLLTAGLAALTWDPGAWQPISDDFGTIRHFGLELLTTHLLAFELTAAILLVAVVGVVILVGRRQA
jgi:NADH-quinone oxidoreductase subunit J